MGNQTQSYRWFELSSSCTTLFSSTQLILHTTLCQHFSSSFSWAYFSCISFYYLLPSHEKRRVQRNATWICNESEENDDSVQFWYSYNAKKIIFWTKKFLACNNRHVALFMLQKKCVLGLGIITDFNMRSTGILNSNIETHYVPLGSLVFMKI